MSASELNFPMEQICGREASLTFPGEEPRICRLILGHEGRHKFPPRRPDDLPPAQPRNHFGVELCEALGIDANEVVDIRLHVVPARLPLVRVSLLMSAELEDRVLTVARRYQLVER